MSVNIETHMNHQMMRLKCRFSFCKFQDPRLCISNIFPDYPHVASAKVML